MKTLVLLSTLLATQAYAKDLTLRCVVTSDANEILQSEVKLAQGQRNYTFGEAQEYKFILSNNANDVVELQAFNPFEPSRSYASAKISAVDSFVELSIWKRDLVMEVRCTAI